MYNIPFQGLLEALRESGEDIFEGVQALIFDPAYNTRRITKLSNSEPERLILQDMSHFLKFFWHWWMWDRMGAFSLCAAVKKNYCLSMGEGEDFIKEENVVEGEDVRSQKTTVFKL